MPCHFSKHLRQRVAVTVGPPVQQMLRALGRSGCGALGEAGEREVSKGKNGDNMASEDAAKASGATYLVAPEILHWEDRATEWSGKPDRVDVDIRVIAPTSGAVIASSVISGKSKWATFGGDHPQDLLPEPVDEYVGTLF